MVGGKKQRNITFVYFIDLNKILLRSIKFYKINEILVSRSQSANNKGTSPLCIFIDLNKFLLRLINYFIEVDNDNISGATLLYQSQFY